MSRLGLLGGSFDPVHYGHLWMAETAVEQLRLDELLLIPAGHSPLKPSTPITSGVQRAEMLELAVGGAPYLRVDRREIGREGRSYTIDTLRDIRRERPDAELYWIIGADAWHDFAQWRDPQQIVQLATVAVVQRAGHSAIDTRLHEALLGRKATLEITAAALHMPAIDVSSTVLRERIAAGKSIRFRTPHAVVAYIEAHGLYRAGSGQ
jgi:nicotinate-nucleotide adenylyltransferase